MQRSSLGFYFHFDFGMKFIVEIQFLAKNVPSHSLTIALSDFFPQIFRIFILNRHEHAILTQMVDIKETSILSTGFNEKIDTVPEVDENSFIDDDMENLAYSDSESASIAMPEEEFCDALDQLETIDTNPAVKEHGKTRHPKIFH